MPLFFIRSSDVKNNNLIISGKLFNHIKNALRYQVSDILKVIDENRTSYQAVITRITNHALEGKITHQEILIPASSSLILAQALIKRKKMETLLEKGAELGVSEIFPLITDRTIIHPQEERWEHQRERWENILLEAAQQSEQPAPPKIHQPVDFKSFLNRTPAGIGFIFWENEREPFKKIISSLSGLQPHTPVTFMIGPEGGFQQEEIDLAHEKGYISVSLGRQKLRSETAVLAAITLLQYELGYFGH